MTDLARDLLIEQLARLRFACAALGIEPKHVDLGDLLPEVAAAYRKVAQQDFHDLVTATTAKKKG